jgi:prepilin signal peptidase PulO-like enzyme (type II secretory pathway)
LSSSISLDYGLLSVNAGVIGAIFIFFSIASMAGDSTIFNFNQEKCSYGFNMTSKESQIAVSIAVGVLLIPFAISSVLILFGSKGSKFMTTIGFALIVSSSAIIIGSLSCRISGDFLSSMMIIPAIVTVLVISGFHIIKKTQFSSRFKTNNTHKVKFKSNQDDFEIST